MTETIARTFENDLALIGSQLAAELAARTGVFAADAPPAAADPRHQENGIGLAGSSVEAPDTVALPDELSTAFALGGVGVIRTTEQAAPVSSMGHGGLGWLLLHDSEA